MKKTDFLEAIQRKLRQEARSRYGVIPEDERDGFLDMVMIEVKVALKVAFDPDAVTKLAKQQLHKLCDCWFEEFRRSLLLFAEDNYQTLSKAMREDFVHDVLLAIHKKIHLGGEVDSPKAFARQAFKNKFVSLHRREKARERFYEKARGRIFRESHDPEGQSHSLEKLATVMDRALDRLPPKLKTALVLRYCNRYSNQKVADLFGVSIDSFKALLSKARGKLKLQLKKEIDLRNGQFHSD